MSNPNLNPKQFRLTKQRDVEGNVVTGVETPEYEACCGSVMKDPEGRGWHMYIGAPTKNPDDVFDTKSEAAQALRNNHDAMVASGEHDALADSTSRGRETIRKFSTW
ncbi:MAG: hypothetical protein EBY26_00215 [Microbacteriaceae bacterium]|nr:hypothetical protein [Microbacteriaceae bacterium]